MSSREPLPAPENYFVPGGGKIWQQLHSERETVCEALLGQARLDAQASTSLHEMEPADESIRDVERRRVELLQMRLCCLDNALDRLMSGSYGHCSECGKEIEAKRVREDPAVSTCILCQASNEGDLDFPSI
jgi:RNA polymerase-binding transcription factor DksA